MDPNFREEDPRIYFYWRRLEYIEYLERKEFTGIFLITKCFNSCRIGAIKIAKNDLTQLSMQIPDLDTRFKAMILRIVYPEDTQRAENTTSFSDSFDTESEIQATLCFISRKLHELFEKSKETFHKDLYELVQVHDEWKRCTCVDDVFESCLKLDFLKGWVGQEWVSSHYVKVQVNDKGSSSNLSSESSKDNVLQAEARSIDASNTDPGPFVPFGILSNSTY